MKKKENEKLDMEEIIEMLTAEKITEEEAKSMILGEDNMLRLNREFVYKKIPDDKKYYFGGTLIGYGELHGSKNVYFAEGAHEKALDKWEGQPILTFHNYDSVPIGEIESVWMQDGEIKHVSWIDDETMKQAIEEKRIDETSIGFDPTDWEFDWDELKFRINEYLPMENSLVLFAAYKNSKIEDIGLNKEELMKNMKSNTKLEQTSVNFADEEKSKVYFNTTDSTGEEVEKEQSKVKELELENKILQFKLDNSGAKNIDGVIKLIKKYDLSLSDAKELLVEEEEGQEEQVKKKDNPELPLRQEKIQEEEEEEEGLADLEERINEYNRTGFGE